MTEKIVVPGRRLGANPRKLTDKVLPFAKYVPPIPVPESADFTNLVSNWPMDGNDQYGDCTCAAVAHGAQVLSAMAGAPFTPAPGAALQLYFDVDNGGQSFPPSAPQDQGSELVTVMNMWKATPSIFGPVVPYAWVDINKDVNHDHFKVAASLFGGLDIALALPITAQGQDVWDVHPGWENDPNAQPGSWGGHAVWAVAFDSVGVTVVTWGGLKKLTWWFWSEYGTEAIAIIPTDWQSNPKFDFAQLQQDLQALGQA